MRSLTAPLLITVFLIAASASGQVPQQQPVWVVTHMANSIDAVTWGASVGANGVEADLRFDANGTPTHFRHGAPCDCSCIGYGVCKHLGALPCVSFVTATDLMRTVATTRGIGLFIIDSKVDASTNAAAGTELVKALEADLFGNGYGGVVVIGAPSFATAGYLKTAATAALSAPHGNRMYFTIDGEGDNVGGVLNTLITLPSANIVYGTGISACAAPTYYNATLVGEVNRRAGVIGFNYIWTIDKLSSADTYLSKGAGGIMTNAPEDIVREVRKQGYTLASTGTVFPAATSKTVNTTVPSCDCNYHPGGCSISSAVSANWACQCVYKGAWTCGGSPVVCQDPSSAACKNPSTNFDSCAQGRGDCQGYKNVTCDCNYHKGGCTISAVAPANTACQCTYKGAWTCGGKIVPCKDFASPDCINPSANKASCEQGRGDCGGYK